MIGTLKLLACGLILALLVAGWWYIASTQAELAEYQKLVQGIEEARR